MSPLADRDTNASIMSSQNQTRATGEENKMQTSEQHKKVLESKTSGASNSSYISPSDAILSPATQKLAGFKQRQIDKQASNKNPTARSLFARTASGASGLEDAEDVDSK